MPPCSGLALSSGDADGRQKQYFARLYVSDEGRRRREVRPGIGRGEGGEVYGNS